MQYHTQTACKPIVDRIKARMIVSHSYHVERDEISIPQYDYKLSQLVMIKEIVENIGHIDDADHDSLVHH